MRSLVVLVGLTALSLTPSVGHAAPPMPTSVPVLVSVPAQMSVAVSGAQQVPYTVTAVELQVRVGPAGGPKTCNLDADLYVPRGVDAHHRAPAVVSTNGYLGDKSQTGAAGVPASIAAMFARAGYVGVSYSGLGWGHSTCDIELDNPRWDGRAAAELFDFLGGDTTHAFRRYSSGAWSDPFTTPPPVLLDRPGDPRVGMIGTSYGGGATFAAAASSHKLDTIIAQATWGDLAYSLAPNNLGNGRSIIQTAAAPGVTKNDWVAQLAAGGPLQVAEGNGGGVQNTCPGFDQHVCSALLGAISLGYDTPTALALLNQSSPQRYLTHVRVPTFLLQGENDSLFNLHEASATYLALRRQHTLTKLLWQSWGHSNTTPAPGEENAAAPARNYLDQLYLRWMSHYLRHSHTHTGPAFEYYRPWVPHHGSGADSAQYGRARRYPLPTRRLMLGSQRTLLAHATTTAAQTFTTTPTPTSYSETSGQPSANQVPVFDTTGTYAEWTTPALRRPLYIVGASTLHLRLSSTAFNTSQNQVKGRLVLFAKIYDVDASGHETLPARLVSPVRIPNINKPLTITLPAIVHRFPRGHHLRLVLAQGDTAYAGNTISAPVTVLPGGTLDIPVP